MGEKVRRVVEEGESSWEDDETPAADSDGEGSPRTKAPDLYSEFEVQTITLRFAVGDEVRCTMPGNGAAEGVVVQRFYREDEWPRGLYAAVRNRIRRRKRRPSHSLSLTFLCSVNVARSTKCGSMMSTLTGTT